MDLERFEKIIQLRVYPGFHFVDNSGKRMPFARLGRPISQSKVALISTGGFHLKDDKPFDTGDKTGDTTFRIVPCDAAISDLSISHTHYKHDYVLADLNCGLPSQILMEMEKEGLIGEFFKDIYTFCGYIINTDGLVNKTAPEIASLLNAEQVDAAILAPT
jgi:hypothetical protein